MRLKTLRQIPKLRGKRALVRTDFNVPISAAGGVAAGGDDKIRRAVPTIQYLRRRGAVTIVVTHLGRPRGKPMASLRLTAMAAHLTRLLGTSVQLVGEAREPRTVEAVRQARPGDVVMLENVRFDPGEETNDPALAANLARLADYFINDAFSNCHRPHASMVGVTGKLPSFAGLLLAEEVRNLRPFTRRPRRPLVAIIGGAKLSTKLAVIAGFLRTAEHVLLGGNLANTVLAASGVAVGRSPIETNLLPRLRQLDFTTTKLHLPVDVVTATGTEAGLPTGTKAAGNVSADDYILDIGPDTVGLFDTIIREAKTIIWNGPMGKFEIPAYAAGTIGIVHALAHTSARVLVGGGETVTALRAYLPKPAETYPHLHLSTGGGALLKFLELGTLPALDPLIIH